MVGQFMTDPALALPALTTLYWVCLIVGGGLLVVSTLTGSDSDIDLDTDIDMDLDLDIDADLSADADLQVEPGHAHAGSLATWFSMQFVVFFMAMFGLVGITLSYMSQAGSIATLIFSTAGGFVVGQGAHQVIRKLRRGSGDSTPSPQDYVDKIARVTISIADGKTGEVALRVGRGDRYIPAVAKHKADRFDSGIQVGVVAYNDGVVDVVSREEYEFLAEGKSS